MNKIQQGKHSRWSRHTRRLGGTPQMWTILSFTGRFDVKYMEEAILKGEKKPILMPGERTEEQKKKVHEAHVARAKLRRGVAVARAQSRGVPLNSSQLEVLEQYRSGELRTRANDCTKSSGHGRLKREDATFVDIAGSTGGFVRVVLDDWEPPNLAEFE